MFFSNPTYLWALLGLFVPIAIHLWSKKEGKTIKIGSVKLLSESDSKQSSSIQLNEWWLLFLRMLLIGILVLIISGFNIKRNVDQTPITYIIEPSLLINDKVQTIIDTIEAGTSLRLLEKGFPELDKDQLVISNVVTPKYWQLAREMETIATDSIIVFTKALVSGIKGKRPQIRKNIAWVVFDSDEQIKEKLKAIKKEKKIEVLSVVSDDKHLSFELENISSNSNEFTFNTEKDSIIFSLAGKEERLPIIVENPIKVLLYYEDDLSNEMTYINASLKVISKYIDRPIEINMVQQTDNFNLESFDILVWLSQDLVPETKVKILAYEPDYLANKIIEPGNSSMVFNITKPLSAENIINEHFSEQLLSILDTHRDVKREIIRYDKRVTEIEEFQPVRSNIDQGRLDLTAFDMSVWLWLVLLVLLILERVIAKYRKQ